MKLIVHSKDKRDRRMIVLIPGIAANVERRRSGSDWLYKDFTGDRRSGIDRRVSNN